MTPKERLLLLADKLEADAANPSGMKFDLTDWFSDDTICNHEDRTKLKPDCNTTGCAIGLAMLTPEFNSEGFKADIYSFDPEFGERYGWGAVKEYFNITHTESKHLFQYESYPADLQRGADAERAVAARILEFVAAQETGGENE